MQGKGRPVILLPSLDLREVQAAADPVAIPAARFVSLGLSDPARHRGQASFSVAYIVCRP